MSVIGDWRFARERKRLAERYVQSVLRAQGTADNDWLQLLTRDRAVALREITFARRAIALMVAERDALDDRTASDVAHALAHEVDEQARRSPDIGRAWTNRWREYAAALAVRGQNAAPAARLARVLLSGGAVHEPSADDVEQATQFVQTARAAANESLRAIFGAATLPEDVRPSALRS